MKWAQWVLLSSTLLLLAAGVFLLVRAARAGSPDGQPPRQRWPGRFLVALAVLAFLGFVIRVSGGPVLSLEFGALMVRGSLPASIALRLLLGLLPVVTLVAWWMCCHPHRPIPVRRGNGSWLTAVAVIVGLLSALQVHSVGPDVPGLYRVYSYDLWSPLLILWLVVCLVGCVLGIFRSGSAGTLLWVSTCAITAVALYACQQPVNTTSVAFFSALRDHPSLVPVQLAAASSETLWGGVWMLCIGVFLPVGLALAAWWLREQDRHWVRGIWATTALGVGALIVHAGAWQLWLLLISMAVIHATHRRWSREDSRVWSRLTRWQRFFVVLLMGSVALGLMVTLHFDQFDVAMGLLGVLLVLIGLAEVLVGGPLVLLWRELGGRLVRGGLKCQSGWRKLGGRLPRHRAAPAKQEAPPTSFLATLKGVFSPSGLVRWAVLGVLTLLALVFFFELPNAGKTIIEPFNVAGMEGDEKLGGAISDQLADALGVLQQELRPDLLTMRTVTNRITPDSRAVEARYTPTEQKAGLSSKVPQEANLELGSVKLPFQVLISPFEPLVRTVLRVHVIRGSLHEYQSHYTLLARDSDGRTWTVSRPRKPPDAVKAGPLPEPSKQSRLSEELPPMVEQLAFDIVREDPMMVEAGLTRWWEAFVPFQRGLREWERSEVSEDAEARTAAIALFQEATRVDPGFALAHYRLGRALQRDGQPARAVEALRNAVEANPRFLPGRVALGFLLYDDSNSSPRTTVASPATRPWSEPLFGAWPGQTPEAVHEDALETWQDIIQHSDRADDSLDQAQAYYGLCLAKTDAAFMARVDTLQKVDALLGLEDGQGGASGGRDADLGPAVSLEDTKKQIRATAYTVRLAYFYCKRAEFAYDGFPRSPRESEVLREGKAQVLNALGTLLERSEQQPPPPAQPARWGCAPEVPKQVRLKGQMSGALPLRTALRSSQARAALEYYARAAELSDHPVIQCNAASVALLLGDPERMDRLELEPEAHMYRAGIHLRWAKQLALDAMTPGLDAEARAAKRRESDDNHEMALGEYQRAVELDPSNSDALNGFAYAFWQWQYHSVEDPESGPEPEDGVRAEQYARNALALNQDRQHPGQGVQVQSTLGEVLLARARPNEAIEVLKQVDAAAPAHPFFDEVRWDLAHAYLCAAHEDAEDGMPRSHVEALRKKAVRLLEEIQRNDFAREDKLFPVERGIHMAQMVDPVHVQAVCTRLEDPSAEQGAGDAGTRYVLRRGWPRYEGHSICEWVGVEVDVFDSRRQPVEGLTFHVWGGGVDIRGPVGGAPVQLGFRPRDTRDFYFVQLEDADQRPASEVHPLRTHANEGNGRCSKNLIRLVFDPRGPAKRAPG